MRADLAALRAVTHPLRLQVVDLLERQARSVRELADELGVARNKLHYHVNVLERHGVIRVASHEAGERRYEATGPRAFEVKRTDVTPAVADSISGILDTAARELGAQLRKQMAGPTTVGRRRVRVSAENHAEFVAALRDLIDRYGDDTAETVFVFALYAEDGGG